MYLVGAPLKILAAYSTAIIECQCAAGPALSGVWPRLRDL